jgi:hypothetical protein
LTGETAFYARHNLLREGEIVCHTAVTRQPNTEKKVMSDGSFTAVGLNAFPGGSSAKRKRMNNSREKGKVAMASASKKRKGIGGWKPENCPGGGSEKIKFRTHLRSGPRKKRPKGPPPKNR